MDASDEENSTEDLQTAREEKRTMIGTIVISSLGVLFGFTLLMGATFVTWRADPVLDLYSRTGWTFSNLISGDGKITMAIGICIFVLFALGAVFRRKEYYGVCCALGVAAVILSFYELVYLYSRSGVITPGNGPFMVFGGGVIIILCSLGGYLMSRERESRLKAVSL